VHEDKLHQIGRMEVIRSPLTLPAIGTPEDVAKQPAIYTGHYLKQLLDRRGGSGARAKRPAQTEAAE
jgi:hypothetical protein